MTCIYLWYGYILSVSVNTIFSFPKMCIHFLAPSVYGDIDPIFISEIFKELLKTEGGKKMKTQMSQKDVKMDLSI